MTAIAKPGPIQTIGETSFERRPIGNRWTQLRYFIDTRGVLAASWWGRSGGIVVLSALELAELPDGSGEVGPQWHVSISRSGKRAKSVRFVLQSFRMSRSEEDNHHPGVARHFWLPVDPARRVDCECKNTEVTVVEPDGYQWTNPADGPCRGCEMATLTGRPCSLHADVQA